MTGEVDAPLDERDVIVVNGGWRPVRAPRPPWNNDSVYTRFDSKIGINDQGEWIYSAETSVDPGENSFIVRSFAVEFEIIAQEGQSIPSQPSTQWGTAMDSVVIAGDGQMNYGLFFDLFRNDGGHLSDTGLFRFIASIRDASDASVGQGVFRVDLSPLLDNDRIFTDRLEASP
jgi:hypothetical protein